MATLSTCIRRAGKALNAGDAAAIREIYNDLRADGMPATEAGTQAIDEYLGTLADEQTDIETQVTDQGGVVGPDTRLRIAADNTITRRIAKALNIRKMLTRKTLKVTPTGEDGAVNMRDIATALQDRAKDIAGDVDLEQMTPEAKDILALTFADEVEAALKATGHAGHWYSDKLRNAVALIGEIHPELQTDGDKLSMFLAGLAITSNGQPVATNAKNAEIQYAAFKESGFKTFPVFGVGKEKTQMKKAFTTLNNLIEARGLSGARQFLATNYTKRELMDLGFGSILSGESTEFGTHGSGIFGPKVGAGFYQNLIGNYDPLTTDRWFMRTWGRMVGKLMQDPNSSANQGRRKALRKSLSSKKGQEKLAELGYNKLSLANDETLAEIAMKLHKEYQQSDYEDKIQWNKDAKNLDVGLNDTIGSPAGAEHRKWIREVIAEARSILEQRGVEVDTASLQALVWFPEKELYAKYGVGDAKSAPTDFEIEYARIAEEQGVSPATIRGILRRKTGRRPRGVQPERADSFATLQKGLEEKDRYVDLTHTALTEIRRSGRTTYEGRNPDRSKGLVVGEAKVLETFVADVKSKNLLVRTGNSAPDIHELDTTGGSVASAQEFTRAINEAAAANESGASVYTYPQEKYEAARLFLTPDGKAGFALMGDDIVSVFKHPDATDMPGAVYSMMMLATQQGGRRLDAFDTILPKLYGMVGFKASARVPWDENEMPDGWDKKKFAAYNNGEPDVVFMHWDPENFDMYNGEGEMFADPETGYGEAVDLQAADVSNTMYPDPGPVRLRIEDDGNDSFTEEHPNHPASQLFKIAATMEDQAQYSPSAVQIIKDKVTNLGDSAIEGNLGLVHRNYLEDFMPDERLSAIGEYNHDIREMEGRKGVLTEMFQPAALKMFWHKAKDPADHARLGEVMFSATINGVDPTKKYEPLKKRENMTEADKKADALRRAEYKVLKEYHDTQLSATAKGLFKEVRDNYSKLRKEMEAAIDSRIEQSEADGKAKRAMQAEMRKIFEAGRVQGPYFPLDRWGDHWGVAYNEEGEVHSFSKFETKAERMAWKASMQGSGFAVKTGKKLKEDFSMVQAIDPALVTRVKKLTAGVEGGEQIADEMYQLYLKSLPEMSMRKHFIHRKGRIGFSENILRSYASQIFHGTTQIARLEFQSKLEDDMRKLRTQVGEAEEMDDKHSDWAAPLYNTMVERHKLAMNPPKAIWANRMTSLGFGWLLGVTPGAAILNLFQTPMFAMPTIAARSGNGATKTTAAFLKAIPEYFRTRIGGYKSKLRGDELRAYEWAEHTGIFSKTMSHDLADLIENDDSAYGLKRNIMTVISWQFHVTEQANRNITFMVAYRLARDRGLNHQDALYDAADLNDRSHYDYAASNRPPIMQGGFAKVLLLFKNYGVHSTYQLTRALKDGFFGQEGLSLESRQEARRKLGGIMMMTSVLGGISSLPLAFAVEGILNAVLGDEDDPYDAGNAFKTYLAEQGLSVDSINAIMNGGWDALTGTTMSSRISLSYLALARESNQPLEGRELQAHILEELAGPVPSILLSPVLAAEDIKAGRVERGIEKVMPKFGRDVMKAFRYANEGALTLTDEPIVTAEQFATSDLWMQAAGLAPNKLTLRYEQNKELKNMDEARKKYRSLLQNRYWLAAGLGDPADIKEAMMKIDQWNVKHPNLRIEPEQLIQSARSKSRMRNQTYGGVALNPKTNIQLRKEMTWLPVETGEQQPLPPGVK